jgi:hypothetical protein
MTNMLRVIEVANGSTFGTAVKWPLKRRVHFSAADHSLVVAAVAKLKEHNITHFVTDKPYLEGTDLVAVLRDKKELNLFAEIYFPQIFKAGIETAVAEDKSIRRSFGDALRRAPRPTPNIIIANKKIDEVRRRLTKFGINA